MVVAGILNFILGIFMILPYGLFYDSLFASLKGTKEGSDWLVVSIIGIVFVIAINGLMYFIYYRTRKKANKELKNLKYWLINIIMHFIPLLLTLIMLWTLTLK